MSHKLSLAVVLVALAALPCAGAVILSENFDSVPFVEKHWTYFEGYQNYSGQCQPSGPAIYVDGWIYNNMSKGIPGSWHDYFVQRGWPLCESLSNVCDFSGGFNNIKCRDNQLVEMNQPIGIDQRNWYDWQMDPTQPGNGCFKTVLPQGWTVAFDWWADETIHGVGMNRGKMGVSKIANEYAYSGGSLHMWSAHGNMRVVSPAINAPAGAYRLRWKSAVWNLAGPDPAIQPLWTDWAQWGWGDNNRENPWTSLPYSDPSRLSDPRYAIDINYGWYWSKDPYHDSDPEGYIADREDGSTRPAGEEAGQWNEWSRDFVVPPFISPFYIGFNCGHAHDPWNKGYRWGTILNVDDVVLEEVPPLDNISDAVGLPEGTLVVLTGKTITGIYIDLLAAVDPYNPDMLAIEEDNRSSGIEVQYDSWSVEPLFVGDRIYVTGRIRHLPTGPRIVPTSQGYTVVRRLGTTGSIAPLWLKSPSIEAAPVRTVGLLGMIWGKVTKVIGDYPPEFIVDDGSNVPSGFSGFPGVRVEGTELFLVPDEDTYVFVTGVLGLKQVSNQLYRIIRPRSDDDVVELP